MRAIIAATTLACACYHGAAASHDIDDAWRGHTRAELLARWGAAADHSDDATAERWTHTHTQIDLPDGAAALSVGPDHVEGFIAIRPGVIWSTTTDAIATYDAAGRITDVRGTSVEWGPPAGANIHWGPIFGAHVGMGRLDDTGTPLPSGGVYIGGMLGPHVGLVGTYSFVSGTSSAGSAIGMAAGMGVQDFLSDRAFVRGGPVAVLSFSPGFDTTRWNPGADVAAGYAFVRVGAFAVDARVDLVIAPGVAFGSIGVGVNRD